MPYDGYVSMTSNAVKLVGVALVLGIVAVACGRSGATSATSAPLEPDETTSFESGSIDVRAGGPSALDDMFDDSFPEPLIDPGAVRSGGPPPDGIPPIDAPVFISVADADEWLSDTEPVLLVDVEGDVRAYPVQILMWHEIVNDVVGGVPLAVTYCPLCNSAIAFNRTVEDSVTTFGTSGRLFNANLVMYDRATETLWNQLDGRAVIGQRTGQVLEQLPSPMISWANVKESHPDAQVLDRDSTGFSRAYGSNPYTGLDNPDGNPFLFNGEVDVRAKAMQRIVAIENGEDAAAWTLDAVSGAAATTTVGEFAGQPLAIFWEPGQASALENERTDNGRDVGNVGVFSPLVDGRELTFRTEGEDFIDNETGSTWNILGTAVSGELQGSELERVTFVRTFWFSWAAFRPGTTLIEG